ncbi:TPA: glycosyltransferase family 4 protein [Candidatus Uhrbacteria bacterium]|nr:glycosyltransferase family 4 protein [Candidatus Uhrbacteria bacterium]
MQDSEPKIALVHDHLTQDGGAERVLRVLSSLYPNAPIYTLAYKPERFDPPILGTVRTSFLNRFPFTLLPFQWLLPLMPHATEQYDLREFDIVISSVSSLAKGIITRQDAVHLCYCHTPTRYLWTEMHEYVQNLSVPTVVKKILPLYLSRLREWDRHAADRVDQFLANSATVRQRILKYYRSDARVVFPPVDTESFSVSDQPKTYFLAGGRIMAYKKFDLIVETFNRLRLPLKIFGSGPQLDELQAIAKDNIEFLGRVSDQEKADLYQNCIAYLNPQEEDFGITVIEAMASGRPVIAYAKGGALETVVEGVTGTFFDEQTWECLADTLIQFDPSRFDPQTIKAHSDQFSHEAFTHQIQEMVSLIHQATSESHENSD